ncbi:MAG: DUF1405 domain-containing protein [Haloarculaceae archaeon]
MATAGVGARVEELVARYVGGRVPDSEGLSRYVAPLPEWLENVGLRLAWPIVLVNLAGTVFGFWYYRFQLADTPLVAWPVVPDSPMATLFIALSLAAWRLDLRVGPLHALAFFGCIKLGAWTPYVQLVLNGPGGIATWLYWFLILSHAAMVVEAFLIHRYARFTVGSVAVAAVWYGFNDVVDYFWPVVGEFHHTILRAEVTPVGVDHGLLAHDYAAACAVVLTFVCIFLALSTRAEKLKLGQ